MIIALSLELSFFHRFLLLFYIKPGPSQSLETYTSFTFHLLLTSLKFNYHSTLWLHYHSFLSFYIKQGLFQSSLCKSGNLHKFQLYSMILWFHISFLHRSLFSFYIKPCLFQSSIWKSGNFCTSLNFNLLLTKLVCKLCKLDN